MSSRLRNRRCPARHALIARTYRDTVRLQWRRVDEDNTNRQRSLECLTQRVHSPHAHATPGLASL
ncbi:MAG: hypothetical protein ACREMA_14040, partial [Longimicrobiales bacterium]